MDLVAHYHRLMCAVKRMREWHRNGQLTADWLLPYDQQKSEQIVDQMITDYFCEELPDTQLEFPPELLREEGLVPNVCELPELPELPVPIPELPELPELPAPEREQLFTEDALKLHMLFADPPEAPARELPDLSQLLRQWKPDQGDK